MIAVSKNQVIRVVAANCLVHRSVIMLGEQTHESLGNFHALAARAKSQFAASLKLVKTTCAGRTKVHFQPTEILLIMFLEEPHQELVASSIREIAECGAKTTCPGTSSVHCRCTNRANSYRRLVASHVGEPMSRDARRIRGEESH